MTQEQKPNPYNKNKDWHEDYKEKDQVTAESLFFKEKEASSEAPKESEDPEEGHPQEKTNQNHDYEKRFKDLKKYHDETITELREQIKELVTKQVENPDSLPKTPEEIETLQKDNPELYKQLETLARHISQQENADVKEKLSELEEKEKGLRKQRALELIKEAHPDFSSIKNDDGFHTWAASKSKRIQDAIYNNPYDAESAIEVLDLYKYESSKKKAQESKETKSKGDTASGADSLVSARNTTGSSDSRKKVWTVSEIRKLKPIELERLLPEINKAQAEGRIVKG